MKYIIDLPEEVVEKANPFEGEIGSALHDAIYLDSFIEGIKGEIKLIDDIEVINGKVYVQAFDVAEIIDRHVKESEG